MANKFCVACGVSLAEGAKFCPSCGKPVASAQQAAVPTPRPATPVQPAAAPAPRPVAPVQPAAAPAPRPVAPVPPAQVPTAPPPQPVAPAPVYTQPPVAPAPQNSAPVQQPYGMKPLNYKIFGSNLPAVSIRLDAGESIYTQSGGLSWMDDGITMATNMQGGLMKGLGRMMSGDSLFMATYTSTLPNREIVIASSFPGSIAEVDLKGVNIIAQKSAFLCAQTSVTLSVYVTRSIGAGLFGGEGFVLQRLSGFGRAFLEIDGSLVERTLAPGEKIKVDTGNVAAFEESVNYQAEMVKGFKNILLGGEGLFLTTLTGPGKVWLQTMTLQGFAKQIIPFLPKPTSN